MLVKVYNVHPSLPFIDQTSRETDDKFGKFYRLKLEPGEFIEMDEDEAQYYISQPRTKLTLDANGRIDEKCHQSLRIVKAQDAQPKKPEKQKYILHATGEAFDSAEEFEKAANKHISDLADPTEKEKQLARGRGRPPKHDGAAA